MDKIVIVVLIYHRPKPTDLTRMTYLYWTESSNPVILIVLHIHQNPLDFTCILNYIFAHNLFR
jgi:hypothetical protein